MKDVNARLMERGRKMLLTGKYCKIGKCGKEVEDRVAKERKAAGAMKALPNLSTVDARGLREGVLIPTHMSVTFFGPFTRG